MSKLEELFELYDKKIKRWQRFQYNTEIVFKIRVEFNYIYLWVEKMWFFAEYDKEKKRVIVMRQYDNEDDVAEIFEQFIDTYIPINDKYNQKL